MNATCRTSSFTREELIVLFVVFGILAGLLLPALRGTGASHARRSICKSNLKQIGLAFAMYASDFGGHYPTKGRGLVVGRDDLRGLGSLSLLYDSYMPSRKVFKCPSASDDPTSKEVGFWLDPELGLVTARPGGCSYAYDSQKGPTTNAAVAIAADKPDPADLKINSPNHDNTGQNVLFFDGHVEWAPNVYAGLDNDHIWLPQAQGAVLAYSDSYLTQ